MEFDVDPFFGSLRPDYNDDFFGNLT
ncbi:hypothetical protein MP638_004020, partial [Amoeboaphelidium occidentale]